MRETISVLFLARNEEKRIKNAIESVLPFADEVIVVDDESTDRTLEVCEALGCRVFTRKLDRDFSAQYNFGIEKARGDWIFIMDADEIVPEETRDWIKKHIKGEGSLEADIVYMRRLNYVWGKPIRYGGSSGHFPRLFRKGALRFMGKVHSDFDIRSEKRLYTDLFIHHFPLERVSKMIEKINFYTDVQVKEGIYSDLTEREVKKRLLLRPVKLFWKIYIKKKGYKDGTVGLVWLIVNNILNEVILYLKVLERIARP